MNKDELDGLLALKLVAEKRSFRAAANELSVSSAAVSKMIEQVERRLGVALLSRTTRSTSPTEAGARFLEQAGPALDQILAAIKSVRSFAERARRAAADQPSSGDLSFAYRSDHRNVRREVSGDHGRALFRGRVVGHRRERIRRWHPALRHPGEGHDCREALRPNPLCRRRIEEVPRQTGPPQGSQGLAGARLHSPALRGHSSTTAGSSRIAAGISRFT